MAFNMARFVSSADKVYQEDVDNVLKGELAKTKDRAPPHFTKNWFELVSGAVSSSYSTLRTSAHNVCDMIVCDMITHGFSVAVRIADLRIEPPCM